MSEWPKYPTEVLAGDEPTHSPQKSQTTLLGAERGTQLAKRLETDADKNLYVHVAEDDTIQSSGVSPLAVGAITAVPDNVLTTIVTHTAATAEKVTKISAGGAVYAKYQLFLNTALIETKRTGPDRAMDFCFDAPLALAPGDVLDVKVTHFYAASLEEFEATVYGA